MGEYKDMPLNEAKKILVSTEALCFWENDGVDKHKEELGMAIHTVLAELDKSRPTGQWIQLKDNVNHFKCSVCGDADYYEDWVPKFCPNCGAQMLGILANKCGSCIHDKEKSEPRTCPTCPAFDKYEPNCQTDLGGGTE